MKHWYLKSIFNFEQTLHDLQNIDIKMVELIMNEIMDSGPAVTWDDIAGLDLAKTTIQVRDFSWNILPFGCGYLDATFDYHSERCC